MTLALQMRRLGKHAAVYGLGGIVSRVIAVFLLPIYTRYLEPGAFGAVGVLVALAAVLVTILRAGISSAFFRFWFDAEDDEQRLLVLRTSFWFTMASATIGLAAGAFLAGPVADALGLQDPWLVRAAFVGIWAQMNFEQLTAVFRVEERSGLFVLASLANIAVTVLATVLLIVVYDQGARGLIVGNFTGTLTVYLVLLGYRRAQLGRSFSRELLREMNRFGVPLVPASLALIAMNLGDRFFLNHFAGIAEVGRYEIGVRLASAMVLLITAFRTAWPAFAYSIDDEQEAKRTYAYVLTYLVALASWLALALGVLSPWLVRVLATRPYYEGGRVVALLAFGGVAYAAYIVMAIGVGRAKRTQFNWVITGAAALVSVALNLLLVPDHGMMGSAIAAATAYTVMFLAMSWYAQRVFPTPYQWRRVVTAAGAAVALTVAGKLLDVPLAAAIALVAAYPLVLLVLGFYLPEERRTLSRRAGQSRT
ncbi:MAG TPA: lipopolysaccharide biosynthesis protein [Gaiellaceae bacterium]|nr:lipopolysaccharide biosynthesis protein [Gaiellaceae bacterium]